MNMTGRAAATAGVTVACIRWQEEAGLDVLPQIGFGRLIERQRPFLEARGQRLAVKMRHDQVVGALDAADVVDTCRDVDAAAGRS